MLKSIWHNLQVEFYLHLYNRCKNNDHSKRGNLIKKAFYHQEILSDLRFKKQRNQSISSFSNKELKKANIHRASR